MQANRHLKRHHSRIAYSDSEADDNNAGDHTRTSLVNNEDNNNAGDEEMNNPETDPSPHEPNHSCTSLVNNEDNNDAVDTAEDKVNFYLKHILLIF